MSVNAAGWVVMSHDALGYTGHEFHDVNVVCDDTPDYFRYGAFQCVDGHFHDSDPATKYEDGVLDCVFSVECLTSGFPVPNFQKTHLAVLRIGDLAIDTLPGEPVSKLGMTTAARTKAGKLVSVAGGGDTVAALNHAGVGSDFTYVSTAGGAFLEWMEGKPLPGVEVLRVR